MPQGQGQAPLQGGRHYRPDPHRRPGRPARRRTAKAVRLYEARGLLPPADRTASGYRCYTEHDIQLLRFIRQARDLGLSLAEIRTIIGLRRGQTPPGREVITLLQAHLDAINHKIASLQNLRQAMTGVLDTMAAQADQGQPARLCRIIDTSDM